MSGECDDCGEHTVDCKCSSAFWYADFTTHGEFVKFILKPPEGCTFRECDICHNSYCFDGRLTNCLYCEINKEPAK